MLIDLIRFFGFKFSKNPFFSALIFFYGFRQPPGGRDDRQERPARRVIIGLAQRLLSERESRGRETGNGPQRTFDNTAENCLFDVLL